MCLRSALCALPGAKQASHMHCTKHRRFVAQGRAMGCMEPH